MNRVRPEVVPGRTQNQITKRTQFDPLFSTKTQNESQIPPGGGGLKSRARASGLSEGQRHPLPCHRERKVALKPSRAALVGTPVGSSCCILILLGSYQERDSHGNHKVVDERAGDPAQDGSGCARVEPRDGVRS